MKIKFLVAEEFRIESKGTQIGIGIYADDVLLSSEQSSENGAPVNPLAIEKLSFLCNIAEMPDDVYNLSGVIFSPSGAQHGARFELGRVQITPLKSATVILAAHPFTVPEFGEYRFDLSVNEVVTSHAFHIRPGP